MRRTQTLSRVASQCSIPMPWTILVSCCRPLGSCCRRRGPYPSNAFAAVGHIHWMNRHPKDRLFIGRTAVSQIHRRHMHQKDIELVWTCCRGLYPSDAGASEGLRGILGRGALGHIHRAHMQQRASQGSTIRCCMRRRLEDSIGGSRNITTPSPQSIEGGPRWCPCR